MFSSDMMERTENLVEMPDMTEAGVKALLAYLYYRNLLEPLKSAAVACELLETADKYGLESLLESMRDLILGK